MRLVSYERDGSIRLGCMVSNRVVDLNRACEVMLEQQGKIRAKHLAEAYIPPTMREFLQGGEESLALARQSVDFAVINLDIAIKRGLIYNEGDFRLAAPLPSPGKIICVGHNYREHILEMKRELPTHPVIFAKFQNTVIGPTDDIPLSSITEQLDYEAEFAFVIGKPARNVPQEQALDYVAGYTIVNDVSARDLQRRTLQWLQGKTLDGSAPMGPVLVTTDELVNPHELDIVLTVNGEERQRSNTGNLVFNVHYLVSFLSHIMTLEPGDLVVTGTPGGVGAAMDPPIFLQHNDVVRIEIDKIGAIENLVKRTDANQLAGRKLDAYALRLKEQLEEITRYCQQPEEVIRWKPTADAWSMLETLCHVEEAMRYWLGDLTRVASSPGSEWGRGLQHEERLAAIARAAHVSSKQIEQELLMASTLVRHTLATLDDSILSIESPHRNPKFGTKPMSFLIDHFLVEHLDIHLRQLGRNASHFHLLRKAGN